MRRARPAGRRPAGPRTLLGRLGRAGFALPYLGGLWRHFAAYESFATAHLHACLVKSVLLARGDAALDWEGAASGDEVTLTFRLGAASATKTYGPELAERDASEVVVRVYRDLNDFLAACGVGHRFLITSGAPVFHEDRLLWLPPPWIDTAASLPGARIDCLSSPPAVRQAVPSPRARTPTALGAIELARLPVLRDIVPRRRIQESDYKASSRESDIASIFREIARFARVDMDCEGIAWLGDPQDHYLINVSWEDETAVVRLTDSKYVDVRPMLSYLNAILARLGRSARLARFEGGHFSGGVVLAEPAELAELRRLAYVVDRADDDGGGGRPAVTVLPVSELSRAIEADDLAGVDAIERAQPYPSVFDRSLVLLGQQKQTRAAVTRFVGKRAGRRPDLGAIVLLAWAEAGLDPPITLEPQEADEALAAWRDTILGARELWIPLSRIQYTLVQAANSALRVGKLDELKYDLSAPKSWIPARRVFDVIVTRTDLDQSAYCNALYAAQRDNTGIEVDRDYDLRVLERCLPFADKNPAIYVNAACLYVELGDPEKAREMLDAAIDRGKGPVVAGQLYNEPMFAPFRDDPRFAATWDRAGVP